MGLQCCTEQTSDKINETNHIFNNNFIVLYPPLALFYNHHQYYIASWKLRNTISGAFVIKIMDPVMISLSAQHMGKITHNIVMRSDMEYYEYSGQWLNSNKNVIKMPFEQATNQHIHNLHKNNKLNTMGLVVIIL